MKILRKVTYQYDIDNEAESADTIQKFKDEQETNHYKVLKHKTDYKVKKDRKTGEIIDENWLTEVTLGYEV